ncbi:MAG TPA: ABC transporter permease subunit [Candidatus Limnocylindrales bacterium]|nr:ABC transporter permease subunit [Candidatus Limnocylindrales bacterium]
MAAVVAIAWQIYAALQGNFLIPTTSQILAAIPVLLSDPKVWNGLIESGGTMLAGFLLAAASGVPIGFLMGRAPHLDQALRPYLDVALVMPMVVVMPIVLIAIGITRPAEVLVVWLFAAPYIIATTRAGVRDIDPGFPEMAHAFGASEGQIWREVLVPGASPAIFTALVFGFGMALTGIIVTELSLIALGVGQLLLLYQGQFDSASVFGLVAIIAVGATVVMTVLRSFERRVVGSRGPAARSES